MKQEVLKKGALLRLIGGDDIMTIFKNSEMSDEEPEEVEEETDEWATSVGDVRKGDLVVLMGDGYLGPNAEFYIHHVESGTVGYVYGFENCDWLWELVA